MIFIVLIRIAACCLTFTTDWPPQFPQFFFLSFFYSLFTFSKSNIFQNSTNLKINLDTFWFQNLQNRFQNELHSNPKSISTITSFQSKHGFPTGHMKSPIFNPIIWTSNFKNYTNHLLPFHFSTTQISYLKSIPQRIHFILLQSSIQNLNFKFNIKSWSNLKHQNSIFNTKFKFKLQIQPFWSNLKHQNFTNHKSKTELDCC